MPTRSTGLLAFRKRHAAIAFVTAMFFLAAASAADLIQQPIFAPFEMVVLMVVAVFYLSSIRTTLTVGTDGVLIDRPFLERLFLFSEILEARVAANALVLKLASGREFFLGQSNAAVTQSFAKLINSRAQDRMLQTTSEWTSRVRRGPRTSREWITFLREQVTDHTSDYRYPALSVSDLRAVLVSGAAGEDVRVASAIALRALLGPSVADELLSVASSVAKPTLRVALEQVATGISDADLEKYLEEIANEDDVNETLRERSGTQSSA